MAYDSGSTSKKQKKAVKDSEGKKRSSSSSTHYSDFPSSSMRSSQQPGYSALARGVDDGIQRERHWKTVLDKTPSERVERNAPSASSKQGIDAMLGSRSTDRPRKDYSSHQVPPRAVPIAPRGPLIDPAQDDDGCRFQCQEAGCQLRFKHRSSRSRHKKKSHSRPAQDK